VIAAIVGKIEKAANIANTSITCGNRGSASIPEIAVRRQLAPRAGDYGDVARDRFGGGCLNAPR
jgi:hypothetical protein